MRTRSLPRLLSGLGLAVGVLVASPARGGGPLGAQGSPITTSSYTIDLFQGPLIGSSRVTAVGGAVVALAAGADIMTANPATPAVRYASSHSITDWNAGIEWRFPSQLGTTDFDNNGTKGFAYNDFVFLSTSGYVQEGPLGIGVALDLQQYELGRVGGAPVIKSASVRLASLHLMAGYSLDDEVHLGFGLRGALLTLRDSGQSEFTAVPGTEGLLTMAGLAPEVGFLWAPRAHPLRLGAAARAPVVGKATSSDIAPDSAGDLRVGTMYLPRTIERPWELEWGFAVQLGERPLNVRWLDPRTLPRGELERFRRSPDDTRQVLINRYEQQRRVRFPRPKLLLSTSFMITGPTANAVGMESFLAQRVDRSGRHASFTPRVGVETEALPNWLWLRAGAYLEPTRFAQSSPRLHTTVGLEARVFESSVFNLWDSAVPFRLGVNLDVARDYYDWNWTWGLWY
ncbi:MAG TPA: hypothetical protein PLR99_01940 [Polyangiaceae bacterium]|nr:hypothetical protein [Polyangiaceae bacterium]